MAAETFRGCFKRHTRLLKLFSDGDNVSQVCGNFLRRAQKACMPAETSFGRQNLVASFPALKDRVGVPFTAARAAFVVTRFVYNCLPNRVLWRTDASSLSPRASDYWMFQPGDPCRPKAQAAPVLVSKAVLKSVPIEIQAIGNVEAYSMVAVKTQVGGELTIVDFKEGAAVRKGDRLFVIDPRPFESQVAQANAILAKDRAQLQAAQANLARDMAQEEYAQAQARRYSDLSLQGVLAKDSAEQTGAQAKAAAEAVRAGRRSSLVAISKPSRNWWFPAPRSRACFC